MEDFLNLNVLDKEYEKSLLLTSINNYIEKIEFLLKNRQFYCIDSIVVNDFKKDLKYLKDLRLRIFLYEI